MPSSSDYCNASGNVGVHYYRNQVMEALEIDEKLRSLLTLTDLVL